MKTLVSVVIPVYNLESYIENCLDSVTAQTYDNLEIICVDDGSTDGSASRIESYARKDGRVKLIRQENSGVSVARNTGVGCATGEYLTFVDGDDFIHPKMIEIFLDCIEKSHADIVCCGSTKTHELKVDYPEIEKYEPRALSYEELMLGKNRLMDRVWHTCWGKLFKREVAARVQSPPGVRMGQDTCYMLRVFNTGVTLAMVDLPLYYYFVRDNSSVTSRYKIGKLAALTAFDEDCDSLCGRDKSVLKSGALLYIFQMICQHRIISAGGEFYKTVKKESKRIGKKRMKDFLHDSRIPTKLKIMYAVYFRSRLINELVMLIKKPEMKEFYRQRKKK